MKLRDIKKFKLIDESYNANPFQLKNAIKNFTSIKKRKFKKYLILGEILELGKKSKVLHEVYQKLLTIQISIKCSLRAVKTLATYKKINNKKRGNIFQQEEDVNLTLNSIISNNDYLMIKESMRLD